MLKKSRSLAWEIIELQINKKFKSRSKLSIPDSLSNESGAATVEFVLWLPVMMLLFGLVIDTSLIFGRQSQILRVVQDANRAVSIGRLRTEVEAEAMIVANIGNIAPNASAETTLSAGIITSLVTIPVSDLTATRMIDAFSNFNVTVTAQHLAEN